MGQIALLNHNLEQKDHSGHVYKPLGCTGTQWLQSIKDIPYKEDTCKGNHISFDQSIACDIQSDDTTAADFPLWKVHTEMLETRINDVYSILFHIYFNRATTSFHWPSHKVHTAVTARPGRFIDGLSSFCVSFSVRHLCIYKYPNNNLV